MDYVKAIKDTPLLLEIHLAKDKQISLDLYPSLQEYLVSGSKFSSRDVVMRKGDTKILIVNPPDVSKLPQFVENGDSLSGYLKILKSDDDGAVPSKGLVDPYGGILIKYIVQKKKTTPA